MGSLVLHMGRTRPAAPEQPGWGCCSSSSLVRVCSQGFFLQGPCSQHGWDGVQSSQKGEALPLLYPALCSQQPGHLLTWDSPSSLVTLNSPPWDARGECAAQALMYWVVMLGLPHHPLHMHSWARITLESIPKAWQRCSCSTAGGNSWVEMCGQTLLPCLGFDDVETSWVPQRCWNQRLLGKSFNAIINSKICMKPNKKELISSGRMVSHEEHFTPLYHWEGSG